MDDGDGLVDARETVVLGEMPGTIVRHPHGSNGFGYDPIFMPDEQPAGAEESGELLTSAEMTPSRRTRSHIAARRCVRSCRRSANSWRPVSEPEAIWKPETEYRTYAQVFF